ncbi:ABC transporter permease subunit [Chloroflexota bacterium]
MLENVFAKTIRDRWLGWAIAVVSLTLVLLFGMSAYREIDLTVYTELPEAYRSLLGIGEDIDVGGLAIGAIQGVYGALTLVAMALAMGASSIAGEERSGTMGLLLGNPKSRTHVLVSKAASMVLLTALSSLVMWGVVYPMTAMLDVEIGGINVGALTLHMFVNALFYGFLATAIGAWTGSKGTASGVTAGVLVLSFFAVGLLPLVEGWEDVAKAFPWYYFNSSEPVYNGVEWGHVGVLLAGSVAFAVAAVIGVNRRDLKSQSVGVTLVDRLLGNPMIKKVIGRLAGSARVSSIWFKTASEYQGLLLITAAAMFLIMGVIMGPMYAAIPEETLTAFEDFPETMIALFGGGDVSTPEGFYQIETFGMMAPIAVMVVTIAIGAGALAGEESRRTMGLLLANPIRRSRIVLEKSWAMVLYAFVVGFATFAGVTLGSVLGGLGMDIGNIAATCLLVTLLGLAFGAFALTLSAGTGRTTVAIFVAVGATLGFHLLNSLAEINETMAAWAKWSPFHYYLGNDPLNNGMDWGHGAILAGLAVVLIALSVVLFQRRDIRQTG